MIRGLFILYSLFFLGTACTPKKENKKEPTVYEPVMYEPTEMAILMRAMYEYNKVLKEQIIQGDSLSGFPEDFLKIHSAEMTDPAERDSSFLIESKAYLKLQQEVFSEKDSVKTKFNSVINSCINCHTTRCSGPIPKIKKLLIK